MARLGRVDDLVAQPVQRLLEGLLRHGEILLARAGEEIGDEGVEPRVLVAAVGRPHAEGAAGALPAELALDRLLDPPVEIGIDVELLDRRELVGVEQRHREADGLLRAAVRVALERLSSAAGASIAPNGEAATATDPVAGMKSANTSPEIVCVAPGGSGVTVRR